MSIQALRDNLAHRQDYEFAIGLRSAEVEAALAEFEARLAEANDKRKTLCSLLKDTVAQRDEAEARAEKAEKEVERWIVAALKYYPPNWAFDPTNPEGTIANIAQYRAALGIGNRGLKAATDQPAESERECDDK